jgi:hypothetical protein
VTWAVCSRPIYVAKLLSCSTTATERHENFKSLSTIVAWWAISQCTLATCPGVCALGREGQAQTAYRAFLTFWKDADPDVPILIEAKADYAKLQ